MASIYILSNYGKLTKKDETLVFIQFVSSYGAETFISENNLCSDRTV